MKDYNSRGEKYWMNPPENNPTWDKADEIAQFYHGDCACDQDSQCTYCRIVWDIFYAMCRAKQEGYEQGYKAVAL